MFLRTFPGHQTQESTTLYFLRELRRNNAKKKLLVAFCIITYCITVWFAGCTAADRSEIKIHNL